MVSSTGYNDTRVIKVDYLDKYARTKHTPKVHHRVYSLSTSTVYIAAMFDSFEKKTRITHLLYVFFSSAKVPHA